MDLTKLNEPFGVLDRFTKLLLVKCYLDGVPFEYCGEMSSDRWSEVTVPRNSLIFHEHFKYRPTTRKCDKTPAGGWGSMKCGRPLNEDDVCDCQESTW